MSNHPAEAWAEQRASPAALFALLILAAAGGWFGWYAYRGELGQLLSATPEFVVDLRPQIVPTASAAQPPETTPSVVVSLTPVPATATVAITPMTPAPAPAATPAPVASSENTSGGVPEPQPLSPAPTAPAVTPPASNPPASPPIATVPAASPPTAPAPAVSTTPPASADTPLVTASALPPAPPAAEPVPAPINPTAPASTGPTVGTATPEAAPAPAATSAAVELPPETPTPDLLAAIGPPPAPVLHAAPPAAVASLTPAKPAGGTQQPSVIDAFLPQSNAGAPAWQRYARPFDNNDPRPRIAIVITKLGLLHGTTLAAIDQLPADVTLSFSPYAMDLDQWIAHARSLGHEVMLDLPMEPSQGGADPGPQGLLTSLSEEENLQRLDWVLGRAKGYVGLAGLLGDRFTASPVGLRPVLRDIANHGLMFLDPHQSSASLASVEATKLRLPRAMADLTIDDTPDRVSIDARLAELERRARITGFAVGLANGYPVTIERLAEWARGLPDRNLALAPVSAIADQQADR